MGELLLSLMQREFDALMESINLQVPCYDAKLLDELRDSVAAMKVRCERYMNEYPLSANEFAGMANTCNRWYDEL